ncbi:DUF2252 domain-containing protein [Limosilactobacillus sp. STM2_1]|uniref:DUF2252 domain-containing protein n=1 Tax=Limosilactobacillus rudii TaxID=2759755 RepID=A0A7W3UM97_9LACO|nr:DUF2252 domain-containing protein [Limosilactobacillus rudii]MBB1078756.1 DUF2252 domain-containing protein [Limosilactobacillus rudii]MBB1098188.1 DUF2252 domain-containing protein [Limosilactobacillus rudii]MCD7135260.1 DUF2252 domain-containing protein [Limosilactobacillus rudii]
MLNQKLDIFDLRKIQVTQTKSELENMGKRQQKEITSDMLGTFVAVDRDPVKTIQITEANMITELLSLRHQRMITNRFAFFRGTAELMEHDLKQQYQSHLPVIICGDAHVNNFGFYASPERKLLFGLNDFDEARIGNWESDLKRLLVSAELAGEENNFTQEDLYQLLQITAKTYRHTIKNANKMSLSQLFYFSFDYETMGRAIESFGDISTQMQTVLNKVLKKSQRSNSEEIIQKMATVNNQGQLVFQDNPPRARHLSAIRYQQIVEGYNKYCKNIRQDVRVLLANFHISDIIRYSVGVGSFGTRCYLLMLTGNDGSHIVLQIKEAMPLRYNMLSLPVQQVIKNGGIAGQRIVTAQRVLQSSSDPFLGSTTFGGRSYYIRQFRDMKESINVSKLDFESFQFYCQTCAYLLAMAHFQSPTAPMIRGYLKHQKKLDSLLANWALKYVDQVTKDYELFKQAIANGKLIK